MFDFSQIVELMRAEPGHGLLQSVLLFMIWLTSRSLKKELVSLKDSLSDMKIHNEVRFEKIEGRLTTLESKGGQ